MPLNTRGLSNNLTWTLFTLALPPSALWGTLTGAWRHNVLFRRAGNVQLSGENAPQPSHYTTVMHHCVCRHGNRHMEAKEMTALQSQFHFFVWLWKTILTNTLKTKIGSGLSVTRPVWFCSKSKITILKVDKVSRNPADHIMNVGCLEIKSSKWFKDDTEKMASLQEIWWKWGKTEGNRVTFHMTTTPSSLHWDDSWKATWRN